MADAKQHELLLFDDAVHRHASAALTEELQNARAARAKPPRSRRSCSPFTGKIHFSHWYPPEADVDRVLKKMCEELLGRLRSGEVQGYWSANAAELFQCLPADAWRDLKVQWRSSTARDVDGRRLRIRIGPPKARESLDPVVQQSGPKTEPRFSQVHLELLLNTTQRQASVVGICVLTGSEYEVLELLIRWGESHRDRQAADQPYFSSARIAEHFEIDQRSATKKIKRVRSEFSKSFVLHFKYPPDDHMLIQTGTRRQRGGYRLNPAVRVIRV